MVCDSSCICLFSYLKKPVIVMLRFCLGRHQLKVVLVHIVIYFVCGISVKNIYILFENHLKINKYIPFFTRSQ